MEIPKLGVGFLDAQLLGFPIWFYVLGLVVLYFMFGRNRSENSSEDKMEEEETEEDEEEEEEDDEEEVEYGEACLVCGEEKEMEPNNEYFDFGDTEEDVWICKDCMKKYVKTEYQEKIVTKEVPVERIVYVDSNGKKVSRPIFNPKEKTEFD